MIFDHFNLKNRIALVTGASRGIGQAIAIALGQAGASVAVHYSQREDAALETAAQIQRSCIVQADLAHPLAAEKIVVDTRQKLGDPDIVVANASVQYNRKWNDFDAAEFEEQVNVNLRSVLRLIQLTAPAMIDRKWGRILTIGSVQQYRPHALMMPYAALKSGMENLCRNFAKQLGPHGITVNNLAPGVIATDRNAAALGNPDRVDQLNAGIAVGFIGKPDDCAAPALLLCSDAGRYITGTDLVVDGGFRLP